MLRFLSPVLLILLLLLLLFSTKTLAQSSSTDVSSLLEFKKGIHVDPLGRVLPTWNRESLDSDGCPSNWHGIECENGSVTAINLDSLSLIGDLKFVTLNSLKSLQNLTLSNNNLTGRLVPGIGTLSSLRHLDLSNNSFYGPIPNRITHLWNLVYLNLSMNGFVGWFPAGLDNLQQLKVLDLSFNNLSGDIGSTLSMLRNPGFVDFSCNGFFGELVFDPVNFSSIASTVQHLNLSGNRLAGSMGWDGMGWMFQNLKVLDVSYNQLVGELPMFDSLHSIQVLRVSNNRFSGSIPALLFGSSMGLIEIDLSCNSLSGTTPRRKTPLLFHQRLKIAIDIARCLFYLHHEKNLPHGNLKPSNVLLTAPDFTAKLTDYCLHRLMTPAGTADQILNLGALGYRAPELASSTKPFPSFKADVYAFGVILMELITRRSAGDIISGHSGAVDLTDWVQMCANEGRGVECYDGDIIGSERDIKQMDDLLAVSLRCVRSVNERPDIRTVFEELSSLAV